MSSTTAVQMSVFRRNPFAPSSNDLYSHLQQQTASKAARHMDAVLNTAKS